MPTVSPNFNFNKECLANNKIRIKHNNCNITIFSIWWHHKKFKQANFFSIFQITWEQQYQIMANKYILKVLKNVHLMIIKCPKKESHMTCLISVTMIHQWFDQWFHRNAHSHTMPIVYTIACLKVWSWWSSGIVCHAGYMPQGQGFKPCSVQYFFRIGDCSELLGIAWTVPSNS
jgi:hypothetical protein